MYIEPHSSTGKYPKQLYLTKINKTIDHNEKKKQTNLTECSTFYPHSCIVVSINYENKLIKVICTLLYTDKGQTEDMSCFECCSRF